MFKSENLSAKGSIKYFHLSFPYYHATNDFVFILFSLPVLLLSLTLSLARLLAHFLPPHPCTHHHTIATTHPHPLTIPTHPQERRTWCGLAWMPPSCAAENWSSSSSYRRTRRGRPSWSRCGTPWDGSACSSWTPWSEDGVGEGCRGVVSVLLILLGKVRGCLVLGRELAGVILLFIIYPSL